MEHSEQRWDLPGGESLYSQRWMPAGRPVVATVGLVHGLGDHSGRYGDLVAALVAAGYAVGAVDLRGHGRSSGRRGHAPMGLCVDDVQRLLDANAAAVPGVGRFLYGHSFGGLVVLTHVLRRRPDLAGAVTTGAALHTPLREQRAKVLATRILGRLIPAVTMPSGLDAEGISRDPAVVAAYRSDPLVHDRASIGFGFDALDAIDAALAASSFPVPLLMLHGGADRITYPSGTQAFAARVGGDCTVRVYDGLYHEIHHEPERAAVFADVVDWLDGHAAPPAG